MLSFSGFSRLFLAAGLLVSASLPVLAAGEKAAAEMKDATGKSLGKIEILSTNGGALLKIKLSGLAPGPHGLRFHETGKCEGNYESAGGIYNPMGATHGFLHDEGPMAGDLPNLIVPASGEVDVELLNSYVTVSKTADENLFDEDGTALVVFERPDDYGLEPDADPGPRIACGVITQQK